MYAALGVAGLCGGVIALSILFKFLRWLAVALWMQARLFIEGASAVLIEAVAVIAAALKGLICGFLGLIWNVFATGILMTAQPIKMRSIMVSKGIGQYAKLRQLYWKYGHVDFKTFRAFKRHMLGEEDPEFKAEREKEQKKTAFQEAQNVMGFSGTEPNTQTELKTRHRQLLSLLHTDKGFPTSVFAQQVNEAVAIIMSVRKWK
jgi:hypothetical protein